MSNVSEYPVSFTEFRVHIRGAAFSDNGTIVTFSDNDDEVISVAHAFYEPIVFSENKSNRADGHVVEGFEGVKIGQDGIFELLPEKSVVIKTSIRKSLVKNIYRSTIIAANMASNNLPNKDAAKLHNYVREFGGNVDIEADYINTDSGLFSVLVKPLFYFSKDD